MADLSTLARPYAKAVFEMAQKSSSLDKWSSMLELLSTIAADESMLTFVASPRVTPTQVSDVVFQVAGESINDHGKNLVKLLAENDRMPALPDIAALFEKYKSEAQGSVDVEITSVEPLSDEHKKRLGESLQRKLGREVRMTFAQDPTLLGGALIKAGDLIIDGTVRGRLEKMTAALAN